MSEDSVLRAGFNRGDGDTIRRIYQKYKDDMFKLAAALLHDEGLAEDVVNDSFVALAESLGKSRLRGNLRSYLRTCVVNRARNVYRATERRRTVGVEKVIVAKSGSKGPEQSAVLKEEYQLLKDAMTQLSWEQREVVILHLQNDLRFRQIAKLQNVSINTAKSRYRCGLDKLRSVLNSQVEK